MTEYHKLSDRAIEAPALHYGFTEALPDIWLRPLSAQLTHLTLYGDVLWGVWPLVDFRQIAPFEKLKSLAFGNLTIAFEWQVDWIISHASSLEQLIFDDATIVTALALREDQAHVLFPGLSPARTEYERQYLAHVSLRWHNALDRFRTELPRLRHFTLGSGNWSSGEALSGVISWR